MKPSRKKALSFPSILDSGFATNVFEIQRGCLHLVGYLKQPQAQQEQARKGKEDQQNIEKKQAREMLEDYERDEAPQGLLNFIKKHQGETNVDKDW